MALPTAFPLIGTQLISVVSKGPNIVAVVTSERLKQAHEWFTMIEDVLSSSSVAHPFSVIHQRMKEIYGDVEGPRPLEVFSCNHTLVDEKVVGFIEQTFVKLGQQRLDSLCEDEFLFISRLRVFTSGTVVAFKMRDEPCRRWRMIMFNCLNNLGPSDFAFRLWLLTIGLDSHTEGILVQAALDNEKRHMCGTYFSRWFAWLSLRLRLRVIHFRRTGQLHY